MVGCFWLLLTCATCCVGFNLSPESAQIFADPLDLEDSYFGYTVAIQRDPPRLMVGAPRSRSSIPSHSRLRQPGAVYTCDILSSSRQPCVQITLEQAGDVERRDLGYLDRKENAWIGGTLDVSDTSPHMVTCGSRWKNQIHPDYYLMNGVCYFTSDSRQIRAEADKLLPLLPRDEQSYRLPPPRSEDVFYYAYGQAGFSVHVTPSLEVIIGAPGVLLWTGTVMGLNRDETGRYENTNIPNPINTPELTPASYFGYAVGSGQFSRGERLLVASAPRGATYRGLVLLFQLSGNASDSPLDVRASLHGQQMGEYFGAALAVCDVDGDGLDDLLVGAPLHSTEAAGDGGAVYVYRNTVLWSAGEGSAPMLLSGGAVPGGRFGSAIAALQDLDLDGFNDVAVGAPYEEHSDGSEGSVYIYRGGSGGLSDVPSQRIRASALPRPLTGPLRGFGISVTRGLDTDGNHYPDLGVGAHSSGHAVVIRASPVARLRPRIERSTRRVTLNTTQLLFEACFLYEGKHLPNNLQVDADVTVDPTHRRAVFTSGGHVRRVRFALRLGVESCKTQILKLTPPASWTGSSRFAALPLSLSGALPAGPFCSSCPVLDPGTNTSLIDRVQVMATCDKEECVPVWQITALFPNAQDPWVVGSAETLLLRVGVRNDGDSAHVLHVILSLPSDVTPRTVPSLCDRGTQPGNLVCLPGFKIDANDTRWFDVSLDVTHVNSSLLEVNVTAHAFDSDVVSRGVASLRAVRVSRVEVRGRVAPPVAVVPKDVANLPAHVTTLRMTHSYQAYCSGYTPVQRVRMEVIVPVRVRVSGVWRTFLNATVTVRVRVSGVWRTFLNATVTGMMGDSAVKCSVQSPSTVKKKREVALERALTCGVMLEEVQCLLAECEAGPLLPRSDSLHVRLDMDVSLAVVGLLLKDTYQLSLNSSGTARSVGDEVWGPVRLGLATLLAGPMPEKRDPLLPLYIALAVLAALALLSLLVLALWKVGFFVRWQQPEEQEELSALKLPDSDGEAPK